MGTAIYVGRFPERVGFLGGGGEGLPRVTSSSLTDLGSTPGERTIRWYSRGLRFLASAF
jgi:hypothetical protein